MVKKIIIKGERCTGTNYLYSLIENNFKSVKLTEDLGWKHSYTNIFNDRLYHQNEYLVIFCFRNAIDWIGSMYYHQWHFNKSKYSDISSFIKLEPQQIIQGLTICDNQFSPETELYWECNPFTLEKPKNICELRNWKNKNFINSKNILKNVMYVNYEKMCANPKSIINEINDKYVNETLGEFIDILHYKGIKENGTYKPKKYDPIPKEDYQFIENNLNWDLENKLGYTKQNLFENYQKSIRL